MKESITKGQMKCNFQYKQFRKCVIKDRVKTVASKVILRGQITEILPLV